MNKPTPAPRHHAPHITADQATHIIGQLSAIQQQIKGQGELVTQQATATQLRIDDLRRSLETRLDEHGRRIETLETNERGTAIKAAGTAGLVGAVTGFLGAMLKAKLGMP